MASGTLLGLCGSLRAGSFNRKLMLEAARLFDPATFVDADLRLPLYDGDLEVASGIPAAVQALADQIAGADAVVIAGPEYNKMLSGVLKNALDWLSRTQGNPWRDKPVAILSATNGRAGGERTQWSLRLALNAFRPLVLPGPEVLVGQASEQFDAAGRLSNVRNLATLKELMAGLRQAARV
ncbi:MAG: NAD(P)H-dependent oxidoreductase [Rhodobacteraceae bacterium]|nr:NAD(P)H-dependent oxidoreductase [Paracoccaceae bacterium]